MQPLNLLRLSLGALAIAAVGIGAPLRGSQGQAPLVELGDQPVLIPHVVSAARELVPVDGQLFVYNPRGRDQAPLQLHELRVVLEGVVVEARSLDDSLAGDPRFGELLATVELLPREVTELQRPNYVVAPDATPLGGPDVTAALRNVQSGLQVLRNEWNEGAPEPFLAIDLGYELDQLFEANAAPGAVRRVALELDWSAGGVPGTSTVSVPVTLLAKSLGTPATLARRTGHDGKPLMATAPHSHAGDLHVHSCHGEAAGACAPSGNCGAESLQLSGSFSYAQLKSQYQALGLDWMTATDHSYCIDSPSEYGVVVTECSNLTDGSFIAVPDIELSSDESGPQSGSDLGDAICLGATSSNHMGAHGISTWKQGGQEAFWGFCDGLFTDELDSFGNNINKVRNEGGWPIANHPDGSSFGWNSVSGLQGIENNDVHGIEIWNGATTSGQGGNVGMWVDWLEDGRILYAYSGSDTHDEAFAFGANHALLEASQPFNPHQLERALREGRSYISNAHVLVHEATVAGDRIGMGSLQTLTPAQQSKLFTLEVHYNFGTDVGTIQLFGGANGIAETTLNTFSGLTGEGVVTSTFAPWSGKTSWTRAYSSSGSKTAYTNPIFYLPGTVTSTTFGTGLGGSNIGSLASASAPAIGASVELDLGGLTGASSAILAMSDSQIPGGLPFSGGFLLINLPTNFLTNVPLDGAGAGSFNFRMPYDPNLVGGQLYWQAVAGTGAVPGGLAFTNAVQMPIGGLGQ